MKKIVLILILTLAGLQLIPSARTNPPSDPAKEVNASAQVAAIFKRSCYDCHSNQTRWPWYSRVAPVSWMVVSHVDEGRKALNFSEWEGYDEAKKAKLRKEIFRVVAGAMPLSSYVSMHPETALSRADKEVIRTWTGISFEEARIVR